MVKERPILFSGEMVRVILEGRKTQTRRVLKPQPEFYHHGSKKVRIEGGCWYPKDKEEKSLHYATVAHFKKGMPIDFCPYGKVGDRLWVRETWATLDFVINKKDEIIYKTDFGYEHPPKIIFGDGSEVEQNWKPSIHMPRWASRILLDIINIRVERLQEITEEDAYLEGFTGDYSKDEDGIKNKHRSPVEVFADYWTALNAVRGFGWDVNPWVWVIEFRKGSQ